MFVRVFAFQQWGMKFDIFQMLQMDRIEIVKTRYSLFLLVSNEVIYAEDVRFSHQSVIYLG